MFLDMNNVTRVFRDSKHNLFIDNIISMKFNCSTDKANEFMKYIILLLFSMFLFFLQYTHFYSIFFLLH